MMDIQAILCCLPHRYPFLMVDRIVELVPGESVLGIKNVTSNEAFFQGHFPDRPVMPGVLIVEAMAQTGGILALKTIEEPVGAKLFLFRGMDRVKFRRPVIPGDRLELQVRVLKRRQAIWSFSGRARVDGEVAAEAELSAVMVDAEGGSGALPLDR